MPLLFALGQHAALEAVQRQLRVGERLFAYHDDIYVVSPPDGVGCNMSCSHMLGSACMEARRRSRTWLGSNQQLAMCWSRLPK